MRVLPFLLAVISAQECSSGSKDLTLTPGATGEDVARATIAKVWQVIATWDSKYEERDFFLRYAYAETNYGVVIVHDVQQIWALSEEQFKTAQKAPMVSRVSSEFNVNFAALEFDEMNIPTYSMLALFLLLDDMNVFPIPFSIDDQATIYASVTSNTLDEFKDSVNDLDQITQNECSSKSLDIIFLVDESGSVGIQNFNLIKNFLVDYASDSNIAADATRIGVRPFSSSTYLYFALDDYKTKNIIHELQNMPYNGGGTDTATGLDAALGDFGNDRPESVKFLVTVTDGASNSFDATKAAADRVKADPRNIQSFAIGVAGANMDELEAIATSKDNIYMLNGFSDFDPIKNNLQNKICEGNVENNNGGDSQIGGSTSQPGKLIMKLGMSGKDNFDVKSTGPLTFYISRTNPQPGPAVYDKTFEITSSNLNTWVNQNVGSGHQWIYLGAYNYKPSKALISLNINSGGATSPEDPDPVACQPNAQCVGGTCQCFDQYANIDGECVFDRCASANCFNGYECAPDTGDCYCPEDHLELDGNCYAAECPESVVEVHNNELGYATGVITSPWFEHGAEYPHNFDCTYEFETIRAEGSCYEVILEQPFGIEASANCENDRLEIFGVLNADQVNMDHYFERDYDTAVLCGRACTAETGWVGKVCGNHLKIRFRSDHMVSDIGWKIKWILRPKEDCDCHCEECDEWDGEYPMCDYKNVRPKNRNPGNK